MTPHVLVDTDILIDVSRNLDPAIRFLDDLERQGTPGISLVTVLELYAGCCSKRELASTEAFTQRYLRIDIDGAISNIAMTLFREYRLSHGLMIADCLIAATAIGLRIPLATKNRRDFVFIDDLTLKMYQ
ncbi:type II toxin-antitoxin system VapC family toxin [Candidatus Thiosymbion oneisti]|uniref:type II toxin-antitoxin system VapC family toxin n=1 Tax=Candidatus Thiosymbion oneisti TaxID=589554 RepID=UPI001C4075BC|nr:type II toxin-antitoxin system VapC family toxin [Candidatus Thiosymbion oneisti]